MGIQQSFPGPSGVTDQTEARKDFAGLVVRDTSGNARAGVFPRHTNALVTARSDMQVDVAAFEGCTVRGGGPLFQSNDGTTQATITTAPGSNSRIDVVYFKQNESSAPYSDADNNAILAVQAGPVSASPVLATTLALLPAGAVPLASVLMPSGKTATNQSGVLITQIFAYTAPSGSPIWVRNSTELGALPSFAQGTRARQLDIGIDIAWYDLYNATTNPAGAKVAGWYPCGGQMPGGMQVRSATAQTLASAAYTFLPAAFYSELLAGASRQQGLSTPFATNSGYTVDVAGIYDVSFYGNVQGGSGVIAVIKKNDFSASAAGAVIQSGVPTIAGSSVITVSGRVALAAGDILRVAIYCAGTSTIGNSPTDAAFSLRYVEPVRA